MNQEAIVYIVDDDPAVRNSLRWLLESVQFKVRACATAQEFLDGYQTTTPGCLLLDVRMPGMSGLDLQAHLSSEGIGIPIIIITGHADVPMAVRALKMGAFDFIEKPFNDDLLLDRVQQAVRRDCERLGSQRANAEIQQRIAQLTPREQEVMRMVVSGKSNRAIAEVLGLSPKTIEVHRAHVMNKMKVRSLADLVRLNVSADTLVAQE
jgi:RNA polymerase sigma factor (sigma-70 family)